MNFIYLLCFLALSTCSFAQATLSQWINPMIGTGGHGHTFPGPVWPFGMVQLSPDTRTDGSWDGCSGYHYSDSLIYGFSHTHLSGTGCSDWGDVMLMPVTGTVSFNPNQYASKFTHSTEGAKAGYYACELLKYKTKVELTVTPRVGIHRYTYPVQNQLNGVLLDLNHRDALLDGHLRMKDSVTVVGYRRSQAWAKDQLVFFCIRFSKPIVKMQYNPKTVVKDPTASDSRIQQAVFYVGKSPDPLVIKVGISAVSMDGAELNLDKEAQHWNFNTYKNQSDAAWNQILNKVRIEESDTNKKTIFYTSLYHSFIHPSLYMDADGQYRGRDGQIHQSSGFTNYSVFSLWDTYRTLHPLLNLLEPERSKDFLNSFLQQYRQAGRLPIWELSANETDCMIGFHSVSVIADAAVKGINIPDSMELLKAAIAASQDPRFGIPKFNLQGFLQIDDESESVSKSLEYAYDNWCIAQLAKRYQKQQDYKRHIKRSLAYQHLFDISTGCLRPRQNGGWLKNFRPNEINNHFTEGNSWQYSFYVPQDIVGLSRLFKNELNFEQHIDRLFSDTTGLTGREQADVTGLIGQYAHGNEPSHHAAFLYHFVGKPLKSYLRVHQIGESMYHNATDGLIGNDDCGQMSAWYVMSSLGIYPFCPGSDQYAILPSMFNSYTLNLTNTQQFKVQTPFLKPASNLHIHSRLNSQPYLKSFLTHSQILKGGLLEWSLASETSGWGESYVNRPASVIESETVLPAPVIESVQQVFKDSLMFSIRQLNALPLMTLFSTDSLKDLQVYTGPVRIFSNTTVKTQVISNTDKSPLIQAHFFKLKRNAEIQIYPQPNSQYQADGSQSLMDGITGSTDWRKGYWLGFQGKDVTFNIDLKKPYPLTEMLFGFLQDTRSWIVFPKEIEVLASSDGKQFIRIGRLQTKTSIDRLDPLRETWKLSLTQKTPYRFVKIIAKQYGLLPKWHPGAGGESFIFIDEIEIK